MSSSSRTLFDSVDLADFRFSTTSIMGVSGSSAKGGITNVALGDSSSGLMTTLHLLNQYANEFAVTASAYSLTAATPGSASSGTLFSVDHTLGTPNRGVGHG
jgi:hypothetical protein